MLKPVLLAMVPLALLLPAGISKSLADEHAAVNEKMLFAFEAEEPANRWYAVNDTVMGGVSAGGCRVTDDGTLEFSGSVSLENNGGFASVRVGTEPLDLSGCDELVMRVRGDGQRYALSVQTDYRIMAGAYYFDFQPAAGQWEEVRVPLRALQARSFGRPLTRAPILNSRDIQALGFMISDKQAGPFRLEIDWIKAVGAQGDASERDSARPRTKPEAAAHLIRGAIGRGVPLFNAGEPQSCAAVYETTAECIVELSAADLPPGVTDALRDGLAEADTTADPVARAWALRRALDAALLAIDRHEHADEPRND